MGAPGGGRPGADWTAAYILIGVGVPVGWAIAVAVAVISERRAARRPVDPRVAATIVALSDVRTFPWRVPSDEEDLVVVASGSNSSSSTAAGSTYVNDDAAADPAAEELVEMQRAQNAWVSESESQSQSQQQQYKSRADMHREKV
ncbi:hypothetical protein MAPG_07343 [Magnaporthiopsis poae ATCC 64411]|uniref:Uncharacterized protein n=1 Tax=Magnaporthiopsis poae (strain ATCC 64411 / 73-15) TaxID=644358 RepID=A0A0C4E4F0_MAGP6|nr:hypothetical protein MAPG_07343 [Magnaporthiopsis poae ATCC 64411]